MLVKLLTMRYKEGGGKQVVLTMLSEPGTSET